MTLTKPLWPVVEYVMNYDYIITSLCENRDKPELECDGKCYLTKQLAQESENSENNPLNDKLAKTELPNNIIAEEIRRFQFLLDSVDETKISTENSQNLFSSLYVTKIPHPPRVG